MIANNIFKATGDFFIWAFGPLDFMRSMDNWWMQNIVSWIFILIGFIALFYWMGQLKKFKNEGTE